MSDFEQKQVADERYRRYALIISDAFDEHDTTGSIDEAIKAAMALADEEIEAAKAYMALQQPEPEYEYALRGKRWKYPSDARFDTLEEVHEWLPRYTQKPSDWVIMRRVTAGEWEDVQ